MSIALDDLYDVAVTIQNLLNIAWQVSHTHPITKRLDRIDDLIQELIPIMQENERKLKEREEVRTK